ncbi:MAG: cyanophycinase [Thermomicrobiales bacterium]|nr:cyanophycinase [Thermomicrobiales bacterium]MCO5219852.1 cyanophycinase [Thermomicrobiales bacterium]MCO5224453.1 cyanophycinase [Thermomicrobiales bacterium]MCO5228912.1 cyanophycinase [Thermomicrobiales bacterium]
MLSNAVSTDELHPILTAGPGVLMPIGGAEDKLDDKIILSEFVRLAGGANARIAIVPTASSIETAGLRYKAIFLGMGVETAEVVYIGSREDANDDEILELVSTASGVFLTGGNQMRLSAIIGGTRLEQLVRERHEAGAVVAGTSAGASILSAHMVAMGASGPTPKLRMAQMFAGFGLINNVIIDQHFRQRDRIGRLLALVAGNPGLLGIGIDEDTSVVIDNDGILRVVGRHSVTIVDGSHMKSDIFEVKRYGDITVSDARLHVLGSGKRFDMNTRKMLDG